jgi:NADH-quinone oxidoreductase subunit G
MEKSPKPIASCAQPATENMVIHTNSPMVKKAREGVMEFLLINHPLDCPICDQAGECDLQDQAMAYGKGDSRYNEEKRAVEDKDFGPLVKTQMTRCIHCTRCVRFITDVAGIPEIGALYRGEDSEITTYLEKAITSELSGNIIDLCPVGALTSKPYAFKARSWELQKTESIDVLDAVGSNIRIDSRGVEVMRILPRLNEDINEEWISDKTRFACDGLLKQRLDVPYVRKNGKLEKATWNEAFDAITKKIKTLKPEEIGAIAGDLIDVESMYALKELWKNLGSDNLDCRQYGEKLRNSNRTDYVFNSTIAGIEEADYCLIIGSNPRKEAAILNARIKKSKAKKAVIGKQCDLTYDYEYLGNNLGILSEILAGKHKLSAELKNYKKPMLILGMQALSLEDGDQIHGICKQIAKEYGFIQENWNGFNVLQQAAARVGGLDIGFIPEKDGLSTNQILEKCKMLYLLGADELDTSKLKGKFIIYQGSHGDKGAHIADVILPGCNYTEKDGTYVNLEGRVQRAYKAVPSIGEAKLDTQIIIELAEALKKPLPYKSFAELRKFLFKNFPHLSDISQIKQEAFMVNSDKYKLVTNEFDYKHTNYYLTDPISRASPTMSKCARITVEGCGKCKQ